MKEDNWRRQKKFERKLDSIKAKVKIKVKVKAKSKDSKEKK